MAISTYKTYLCCSETSDGTFAVLTDIKDFPDLGGDPEMLETTTLSNGAQTFINGIQTMDALSFTANFDKTIYDSIKGTDGLDDGTVKYFKLYFKGKTATAGGTTTVTSYDCVFAWSGMITAYVNGGGVDEVIEMTIVISPSTEIVMTVAET